MVPYMLLYSLLCIIYTRQTHTSKHICLLTIGYPIPLQAMSHHAMAIFHIELCGMMTQNCVLFTMIAEQAKKYKITVLGNCCTSVSPVIHAVTLKGLSRITNVI
ncbi:isochorismatase family protein [Providencia huaxiensis]|uniref:isochorismatase family protein n=2 Tax=Providencia TaxID=586 RepID=UPI0028BF4F08|nr:MULTISPECIES: isochorismatase family protein [Providencia]